MPNITKRDLVVELSNRTGQTQSQVFEILQATLDLITDQLAGGNDVTLRRFGTFELRMAKSKVGRNPKKKDSEVQIPARVVVKFKPSMELKGQVLSATLKPAS